MVAKGDQNPFIYQVNKWNLKKTTADNFTYIIDVQNSSEAQKNRSKLQLDFSPSKDLKWDSNPPKSSLTL